MIMTKTIAKMKPEHRVEAVDDLPEFRDGREFDALSEEDKERVSKYYDRPIPLSETRPLNGAQRKRWERIKRKAGRPAKGEGAKAVRVTIEGGLLRRADRYAETAGFTRSQLIGGNPVDQNALTGSTNDKDNERETIVTSPALRHLDARARR
jgi:hypothetical protein